jgi:hypothetical protein
MVKVMQLCCTDHSHKKLLLLQRTRNTRVISIRINNPSIILGKGQDITQALPNRYIRITSLLLV